MQFFSTLKMNNEQIEDNLKYFCVPLAALNDFQIQKRGSGFIVSNIQANNGQDVFLITSKKNIWNDNVEDVFQHLQIKPFVVNKQTFEISSLDHYLDIELSQAPFFVEDDIAVYKLNQWVDKTNYLLSQENKFLYIVAIDLLNFLPVNPMDNEDYKTFDLNLFEPIKTLGYQTDVLSEDVYLIAKEGKLASDLNLKINQKDIFLVDNGLVNTLPGGIVFNIYKQKPINFLLIGMVIGYQSISVHVSDSTIEYPNGLCQIIKAKKIMELILKRYY